MKPIKFITTFSKTGYDLYGKTWIETFTQNVKDENITVDLYVDFAIKVTDSRINVIDYDSTISTHKQWLKDFEAKFIGSLYNKKMAMRFSYKSFVMQHALRINLDCYLIWLDGDCIFKMNQNFSNFEQEVLNDKFIAVQREHVGGNDHCESGFVLFDTAHKDKDKFLKQFVDNYKIENVIEMTSPYDGFIIYKSLKDIEYVDLNDGYGKGGIQSDPNETFLNPILKERFLHNIGVSGKAQYTSWNVYSKTDEYFKLIVGRERKTPEQIKSIRQQLIERRNQIR